MEENKSKHLPSFCDDLSNSCLVCPEMDDVSCVCVCVCVCVWWGNRAHRRARERETEIESVCLDQLHSKSVYSAQFGIKHNRLLSACYRLWLPIKMEFIAALRASPNYTFFPLHSVLFPLSHLHSFLFHGCSNSGSVGCFFPLISSSSCQTSRHNSSL